MRFGNRGAIAVDIPVIGYQTQFVGVLDKEGEVDEERTSELGKRIGKEYDERNKHIKEQRANIRGCEIMTIELLLKLVFCHLIGDYVLQIDFIARTKGENWYHLFVHCVLYCLPFYVCFGINWRLLIILVTHLIIDSLKARYKKISYTQDQVIHYITMLIYLV